MNFGSMYLLLGLFLLLGLNGYAQDPVKAAPNVYKKVLLDNNKVRVIQLEFAAGDSTVWHHHPNHVIYALSDGMLKITNKGQAPNIIEVKEGTAMYLPAVTHVAKNVGTNSVKLIVTELKPAPVKKMNPSTSPAVKK